ncbi:MAG: TetR/AcrR family transcriptional regulator [Candidatus Woesearchaeota archaeon]
MRKRLSSKERRNEILEKSLEIIYKKGFYNLTMRNIAEKINISEAALYKHFKNKREIITKLADQFFCHDDEITKFDGDKNSIDKLKSMIKKQFEIFSKNPLITVITFQEEIFREYPDIWNKFNYHREIREKILRNIILEGKKNDEIIPEIDEKSFSTLIMGAIRMTVIKWRGSDFSFSINEKGNDIINELLRNIKN